MTVTISDIIKSGNTELIKTLAIEQVEKLWNTLQIKGINGSSEKEREMQKKCVEVLECLYRKPWDENIFFKIIQMRLDLGELSELSTLKKLFSELEMNCPFLPKVHVKRLLELKGDFVLLKLKDGVVNDKLSADQIVTEMVEVLVEYKKKGFSMSVFGSKILEFMKSSDASYYYGKQLETLIPECEEFKEFQVDLLNILTEMTLNRAASSRKTAQFSEFITEAINLNVKSLNLRPNVMGYFEFLKLTILQDPRDFAQAVEICLATLKNRIRPNEDIRGKLQIIRLIVNEGKSFRKGLDFAVELFSNYDFSSSIVLEDLLGLIEEHSKTANLKDDIEDFLLKFSDPIRTNKKIQRNVLETLLRLAEKNSIVKEDYLRCEVILRVINGLGLTDEAYEEGIKMKLVKCYLKLDKLNEAKETLIISDSRDWLLLRLELALRIQDDFSSLEAIEKLTADPLTRAEHFLMLFNQLKVRMSSEMKMKLLKTAQGKLKSSDGQLKVDLLRGIIGLVYDSVMESGLTLEYREELDQCFTEVIISELSNDQVVWLCQVCWNLGVIHARAEDFIVAQYGFKWCQRFSQESQEAKDTFMYKAGFYYLTAKVCGNEEINEEDYEILKQCEESGEVALPLPLLCLKVEMLIGSKKWEDLKGVLTQCTLGFEALAEIILRASEEIPLEIYRQTLDKLTEDEFESDRFDMIRFSGLYRGLTTCALLQFPSDLSHFHSAVRMIKSSFGKYPSEETVWLCSTALEMGRRAVEIDGDWEKAGEWTEMAMNLVYLIPTETDEDKLIRINLQEAIQKLFEKVVNRN